MTPSTDRRAWRAFLVLLPLGLAASVVALGFFAPYWRHADQDLVLVYQGYLLKDGLPQEYFDHPGYAYFLVIGGWTWLLDLLGLTPIATLADLPPVSDPAALDAAWTAMMHGGRALSIVLAIVLVLAFAAMVRAIWRDDRLAILAGIAFASGMGIMTQARQLRTEMVSGGLVMLALMLALWAARRRPGLGGLAGMVGAGACAAVAMTAKVQAIFPIMAIPLVATALGRRVEPADPRGVAGAAAPMWAVLALALAALAALPAWALVQYGLDHWGEAVPPYRPLGDGLPLGLYQGVVGLWAVAGVSLYARVWRVSAGYAVQAFAALFTGLALGLLVLLVRHHPMNVVAVVNFVEQMFVFSSLRHGAELGGEAQVASTSLLGLLLDGAWRTFAIRTIVLHPDNIPQTLVIEWFVIFAAVKAWRAGRRWEVLAMTTPLAIAWGLETVFSLRGFQRAYAIYTDPFTVLAAVAALRTFSDWLDSARSRRWVYAGVASLVVLAHVWPVVAERRRFDPAPHCAWIPHYMPHAADFPFCVRPEGAR